MHNTAITKETKPCILMLNAEHNVKFTVLDEGYNKHSRLTCLDKVSPTQVVEDALTLVVHGDLEGILQVLGELLHGQRPHTIRPVKQDHRFIVPVGGTTRPKTDKGLRNLLVVSLNGWLTIPGDDYCTEYLLCLLHTQILTITTQDKSIQM